MAGVFMSYRRVDSLPWAGRLFDSLRRHFDSSQVFMDINGGIPRGANFESVLTGALGGCDALLALIGPQWLKCTQADGITRRLDAPHDWVRGEITACLQRGVPVVPVLFGGAPLPNEEELPADLRPLCKRQAAVVADADWHPHVAGLINDLLRVTKMTLARPLDRDDVESANTGIRLLSRLFSENEAVADAVGRSREVVENTYRRISRLDMFKEVHEALHMIESRCLRPLQVADAGARLRPFRGPFSTQVSRIRAAIAGQDLDPALRDDIEDNLDATEAAFAFAGESPGEPGLAKVIAELNALMSGLPSRLDAEISRTARDLDLDRLVELMNTVKSRLTLSAEDRSIMEFVQSIDALQRLRDELNQLVQEHTQLQRLDSKLRTVSVGGFVAGTLAAEWGRIKLVRARLATPSAALAVAFTDLQEVASDVETKLNAGEEGAALDFVREYFRLVADMFLNADGALKRFCLRLTAVSQALKTILELCR